MELKLAGNEMCLIERFTEFGENGGCAFSNFGNKSNRRRLEADIREIDHTIDAIVFDLYGLTEEEKLDIVGKFREVCKNG